ncbi:unnamed protein product [Adineta steineri]|uniref:F-box domain-containing protein n=1 Tax=Adineta steineri TaxID=433720 RepID=A0A815NMS7_9BILA|nr:unnamed protein product [Adineta steineri]CAF4164293.1 unnamed protein product [Adineta steineri]
MNDSIIQLNDLPDEILMMIFGKLWNVRVLYSLIGINRKLDRIACDPVFTRYLQLMNGISDNSVGQLPEIVLNRFCSHVLPKIHHHIRRLDLESSTMERILSTANYPNLHQLVLLNLHAKTAACLFTTQLYVCLSDLTDCLYLLDGRFSQLHTLRVYIVCEKSTRVIIDNKDKLPNLERFSLDHRSGTDLYDNLIVPLLQRMINLEELDLYLTISGKQTVVDGTDLKKNILNYMSQLKKFSFSIRSNIYLNNEINLPSNDDIQNTFKDFKDNEIISYVHNFSRIKYIECRIFSYPYRRKEYERITNDFPSISFSYVREISLFDNQPFEHDFFLRITQAFPNVKILRLENEEPQKKNHQDSSITRYFHLTELHLLEVHDDYIEEFLSDSKTCLPNTVDLTIEYEAIQRVTENFTRSTTQINCSKLIRLNLYVLDDENDVNLDDIKHYFPHAKIFAES